MKRLTPREIDECLNDVGSDELASLWRNNEARLQQERQGKLRELMGVISRNNPVSHQKAS